jgi:hypothetical protein
MRRFPNNYYYKTCFAILRPSQDSLNTMAGSPAAAYFPSDSNYGFLVEMVDVDVI